MDKEKQKGEEFPEGAEVLAEIEKIKDPKDPPFKKVKNSYFIKNT